jgi:heat-inducible transcriptional repressor
VSPRAPDSTKRSRELTDRQASVLRAVVAGYVGDGNPMGSRTLSHLLSVHLSSATIRNVLGELSDLGLVEKPHASAGRVPTELGLRTFVDALLPPAHLAASQRRDIAYQLDGADADRVASVASTLLSHHTSQLGFVVAPRLDRLVLRHLSLVRLSAERLLVVLISQSGSAYRCVIDYDQGLSQSKLDRIATLLNDRVVGDTIPEVRERLAREARSQKREANELLARALELGSRALAAADDMTVDLVIESRLSLLGQPEFSDPRRLRDLFEAIETKERLLEVLDQMLENDGVSVAIGEELEDPALRRCAVVATRYGAGEAGSALGTLGVIGPSRMDFGRVIPLVDYLSELVTGKLRA